MSSKYPVRAFDYATVYNVVDGDTVDIEIDLGFSVKVRHRFRLARINAPERGHPGAAQATAYLKETVLGKPVTILSTKIDKYGRYLCDILLSDDIMPVNDRMVERGLATPYV